MSDRNYIAWSLLTAAVIAAIGFAASQVARYFQVAERVHTRRGRKLQAQLALAMARAPSRYFEDSSMIEREIARHDALAPPIKRRFPAAFAALGVIYALWFRFIIVDWLAKPVFGVDASLWPKSLNWVWMPILGLQNIMFSLESDAENPSFFATLASFCWSGLH